MQSKIDRDYDDLSKNQSDSDDWTLVSPPESANSSGTSTADQENMSPQSVLSNRGKDFSAKKQRKDPIKQSIRGHKDGEERRQAKEELEMRASGSQDADDEEDDGLVEIDLNVEDEVRSCKSVPERVVQSNLRSRKSAKNVEFASVLVQQQTATKMRDCSTNTQAALVATPSELPINQVGMLTDIRSFQEQTMQQEENVSLSRRGLPTTLKEFFYSFSILVLITLFYAKLTERMIEDKSQRRLYDLLGALKSANNGSEPFDLFYVAPDDTAHMYLKKLDAELEACIRNNGYGWLKDDGKLSHPKDSGNLKNKASPNPKYKPFRGIVCYDRETKWREKFKKLKEEFNVDLLKLSKQGYKRLASNFLQEIHSGLRFSLVLNQLEYLNYLDELRRKQEMERLKAENLELKKRLMKLESNTGGRKVDQAFMAAQSSRSLARLENENGQLKRENDALKASLVEKAGTIYIKQSLELEKCDRENNALKQFHQLVAHEVSKSLKQLDLSAVDAAALLNDHESLSSQLSLTRGYLLRLGEEITKLVYKSKNAVKESEFYRVLLDTLETTPRAKQIEHSDDPMQPEQAELSDYFAKQALDRLPTEVNYIDLKSAERMALEIENEPLSNENKSTNADDGSVAHQQGSCMTARQCSEHLSAAVTSAPPQQEAAADARGQVGGARGNWLMRRAKLRERLRRSSGIDILEKQIDRLIDENKYLYNKRSDAPRVNYYNSDKETRHYHSRKQHTHKLHQDATKHDSHPPKRESHMDKKHHHTKTKDAEKQRDKSAILKQLEAEFAKFRFEL